MLPSHNDVIPATAWHASEAHRQTPTKKKRVTHLIAVSSLKMPASSSSEGTREGFREGLRDVFRDDCREDAAEDPRGVALAPSEASFAAALRETVFPPPRARRRRSMVIRVSV